MLYYIYSCRRALASCIPVQPGCTDSVASNFVGSANTDDSSCRYDVYGCTDETALNFDSTATVSEGCVARIEGCTNATANNYASDATVAADDSCAFDVYGCSTPACRSNPGRAQPMGPLTLKKSSDPPLAMASDRSLSSASPSSRAPHESPCLATAGAGSSCTTQWLLQSRSARPRERFSDLLTMIGGTTNLFGGVLP